MQANFASDPYLILSTISDWGQRHARWSFGTKVPAETIGIGDGKKGFGRERVQCGFWLIEIGIYRLKRRKMFIDSS